MNTENVQGMIGHFGLQDWWLHELSGDDRELVLATTTRPDDDETSLLHGSGFITSQNPSSFLTTLAGWFMGADPSKRELALRMADKAWELKDEPGPAKGAENVFARHSALGSMMKIYYRHRANPEYFERAIECAERQIEMQAEARQAWQALEEDSLAKLRKYNPSYIREHPTTPPGHLGYKQLAIVLEKEKRYQEALDLVEEAKAAGWSGDWDKRADRIRKKLS